MFASHCRHATPPKGVCRWDKCVDFLYEVIIHLAPTWEAFSSQSTSFNNHSQNFSGLKSGNETQQPRWTEHESMRNDQQVYLWLGILQGSWALVFLRPLHMFKEYWSVSLKICQSSLVGFVLHKNTWVYCVASSVYHLTIYISWTRM